MTSRRDYLAGVGIGIQSIISGCSTDSNSTINPGDGNWKQIGRNSQNTGSDTTLPSLSSVGIHWKSKFESDINISGLAIIGDDLIVCGSRQTNYGFLSWVSLTNGEIMRIIELSDPVVTLPTLCDDLILVTCQINDQSSQIRAFDYDGNEQWDMSFDTSHSPSTIYQSNVYMGCNEGRVFALEKSNGDIQWERKFGDYQQGGAISAPLTVDETGVYVPVSSSTEQGIYSLSRNDGETNWVVEGPRIQSMMARMNDILLVSYRSYDLVAFDIHTGERRWSNPLIDESISPPAVTTDTIVVADGTSLYALDPATGEELWKQSSNPSPSHQPVIVGEVVIINSDTGLMGYSLLDGEELWEIGGSSNVPIVPVENGMISNPSSDTLTLHTNYRN